MNPEMNPEQVLPEPEQTAPVPEEQSEQPEAALRNEPVMPAAESPVPVPEQDDTCTQPVPAPLNEPITATAVPQSVPQEDAEKKPNPPAPAVPQTFAPPFSAASQPPEPEDEQEKKQRSRRGFRIFCGLLAAILLLSCGVTAGYFMGDRTVTEKPQNNTSDTEFHGSVDVNIQHSDAPGEKDMTIAKVNDKVSPCVVVIHVYSRSNTESYVFSSGVVLSRDGYIITNDHIFSSVTDPAIYVMTRDQKTLPAKFVAGDSRRDIAILKVDDNADLTPATFGYSKELYVGQQVVAIGHASGMEFTVSSGIVSALNRRVKDSEGYSSKFVQTTAPISGGSSGGALVNMNGQVIGITSSKLVSETSEGICFAIPADEALATVQDLMKNGHVTTRGKLGITYQELTAATADLAGLPTGLQIYTVTQESSLYGKVRQGDIITKVDGKPIVNSDTILDAIEAAKPGDKLTLTVSSSGKETRVTATLLADPGSSHYTQATQGKSSDTSSDLEPLYPDLK